MGVANVHLMCTNASCNLHLVEAMSQPQLLNLDRPDGSIRDPVAEPVQVC
jgi:hypothetical protein